MYSTATGARRPASLCWRRMVASARVVHATEADSETGKPASGEVVGGLSGLRAAPSMSPHDRAFESDLAAWLTWLNTVHNQRADETAMRRLGLVYAVGWAAVTAAVLFVPVVGVVAVALTAVVAIGTMAVGLVVTRPTRGARDDTAADDWLSPWLCLPLEERARLLRIINLSRVATRPLGASLLLAEVDQALAERPFANWRSLHKLHDLVLHGPARVIPFQPGEFPVR